MSKSKKKEFKTPLDRFRQGKDYRKASLDRVKIKDWVYSNEFWNIGLSGEIEKQYFVFLFSPTNKQYRLFVKDQKQHYKCVYCANTK